MCEMVKALAGYCGSTALASSMHQHLLAASIWKYRQGQGGEPLLQKIAKKQPVLVSTGARDWLESNGELERAEGGYQLTAKKFFASQSEIGDLLVTSAPYNHPKEGWRVLHFAVPMDARGVRVMSDWRTLGMRGTGSQTVELNHVFIPESSVVLSRPRGQFHPVWNVVLTAALPLIMSVYVGIAEKAARMAIENARQEKKPKPHLAGSVGELVNEPATPVPEHTETR